MARQTVTTTTKSWREIVEQADGPERHKESLYPEVYQFGGGGVRKRDSGPTNGPYNPKGKNTYVSLGAEFDGTNDYMTRGSDLTGVVETGKGTISAWFKFSGTSGSADYTILSNNIGVTLKRAKTTRRMQVELRGSGPSMTFTFRGSSSFSASAGWFHVLTSFDTNFAPGSKLTQMYINGSAETITTVTDSAGPVAYDINSSDNDFYIGVDDSSANAKWNGALAQIWFDNRYIDLSDYNNRENFIRESKPVDLGTDGAVDGIIPLMYHRIASGGAAADLATNLGHGGDFSITGSLALSSTNPSD